MLYQFHSMLILQAFTPESPMLIPPIIMPTPVLAAAAAVVAVLDMLIVEVLIAMELCSIFIFASSLEPIFVEYVDRILGIVAK
jgi:energy-converting hydrogenase Eha subunit A